MHPVVAILNAPGSDLTPLELADLMGYARQSISEAVRDGRIEAISTNCRGAGACRRHRITKIAAIRWIWCNTTGERETLRAILAERAPAVLKLMEKADHRLAQSAQTPTAPKPSANAWHPDQLPLF